MGAFLFLFAKLYDVQADVLILSAYAWISFDKNNLFYIN